MTTEEMGSLILNYQPQPGSVVFIRLPAGDQAHLTQCAREMARHMKESGAGLVVIFPHGHGVEILTEDEMRQHGWERISP